uniref:Uncharacterized protein n=1 Tax=Solanum lycopersicum TaxID=4081 RepID=A0A3Q7GB84_SOLLC
MDSTSNPDTHESCMQYLLFPQMNLHCRQKSGYQDPDDGRQRFLLELEIRSCLVNPTYIPLYPHCLFFLELLQNPSFLNAIAIPPGFGLAKTDLRNASVDQRKRNRKDGFFYS